MTITRKILTWVASRMRPPRVIRDALGQDAYLSRYYLVRHQRPFTVDGSEPFDSMGLPKPTTAWPKSRWGLYLHHFHRSDADLELHNHPWRWAVSLVLAGGYSEERRVEDGDGWRVARRRLGPWRLNFLTADTFHRVDLLERDAWTIFLVGPKAQGWGFWDRETGEYTPWREFIARQSENDRSRSP